MSQSLGLPVAIRAVSIGWAEAGGGAIHVPAANAAPAMTPCAALRILSLSRCFWRFDFGIPGF